MGNSSTEITTVTTITKRLEKGFDRVNIAREHMYIIYVHIKWGVAQELVFYIRS